MSANLDVRLGVSLTRTERNTMRRRWGASKMVAIANSLRPWDAATCTCHGLSWDVTDLSYAWGATVADQKAICPLSD